MTMSSAAASALLNGEGDSERNLFHEQFSPEESSAGGKTFRKPFMKRHSAELRPLHGTSNRVNKYLSQAIEGRSIDQEKSTHVNLCTLCFKDRDKEKLYHEDKDTGFVTSVLVAFLLLILLTAVQVMVPSKNHGTSGSVCIRLGLDSCITPGSNCDQIGGKTFI